MSNSAADPNPRDGESKLSTTEYIGLLKQQVNRKLFMPSYMVYGKENEPRPVTQMWSCSECDHELEVTVPDEQLPALHPHADVEIVQMWDEELLSGMAIQLACPECLNLHSFGPREYMSEVTMEFRGVTTRGISEWEDAEVHIDDQ